MLASVIGWIVGRIAAWFGVGIVAVDVIVGQVMGQVAYGVVYGTITGIVLGAVAAPAPGGRRRTCGCLGLIGSRRYDY